MAFYGSRPVVDAPRQYSPLSDAIQAGTSVFNAMNKYRAGQAEQQKSLAGMAKSRAEAQLLQNQNNAQQILPGTMTQLYRQQAGLNDNLSDKMQPRAVNAPFNPSLTQPMPEFNVQELSPRLENQMAQGDALSNFMIAGGGDAKNWAESLSELSNQQIRQGLINDQFADNPVAINAVANQLNVPDMYSSNDNGVLQKFTGELRAPTGGGGQPIVNKKVFDMEQTLQKESAKLEAPYRQRAQSYARLASLYNSDQSVSDVGMIFDLMKMFDPTSTVREGEYATVANSGGVPAEIVSLYNRWANEGRLPADVRDNIMNTAKSVLASAQKEYDYNVADLKRRTELYPGLDYERVRRPVMEVDTNIATGSSLADQSLLQGAEKNEYGMVIINSSPEGQALHRALPSGTKYMFVDEDGNQRQGVKR